MSKLMDNIPDEEFEAFIGSEEIKKRAKKDGLSIADYIQRIRDTIPDEPLPLTKEEKKYGEGVVERLGKIQRSDILKKKGDKS